MKCSLKIASAICAATLCFLLSGCTSQETRPKSPDEAFRSSTYLNGRHYLRGINIYTLQQQRDRPIRKIVPDNQETYDYLASRGFSIVRLAVPWEGLQPLADGEGPRRGLVRAVDKQYLTLVRNQVRLAERAGMRVVVDLHNGCTYPWGTGPEPAGTLYCGHGLTLSKVQKVWRALSDELKGEPGVAAYNLFNEPRKPTGATVYYKYVNAIVADLRSRGDDRAIWVDTILNSSFANDSPNHAPISDPADAVIYSQHFYLHGASRAQFLKEIESFGGWCARQDVHCAIGEIGWPATSSNYDFETFRQAYKVADQYEMDVTYFSATSVPDPKPLIAYYATDGESSIDSARKQSRVIEDFPSR